MLWTATCVAQTRHRLFENATQPSDARVTSVVVMPLHGKFHLPCWNRHFPYLECAGNCDFEGEVGVITAEIPMGATPAECEAGIRLLTLFNDVSMRTHLSREMAMGFGFIQAKPATVFAPVAVTVDELGCLAARPGHARPARITQ
jgi:2-keto-4-pentenoate hydratase/2-oxohepta-3-ene-1,7-dioic acid hydratase in catechol pathway